MTGLQSKNSHRKSWKEGHENLIRRSELLLLCQNFWGWFKLVSNILFKWLVFKNLQSWLLLEGLALIVAVHYHSRRSKLITNLGHFFHLTGTDNHPWTHLAKSFHILAKSPQLKTVVSNNQQLEQMGPSLWILACSSNPHLLCNKASSAHRKSYSIVLLSQFSHQLQ